MRIELRRAVTCELSGKCTQGCSWVLEAMCLLTGLAGTQEVGCDLDSHSAVLMPPPVSRIPMTFSVHPILAVCSQPSPQHTKNCSLVTFGRSGITSPRAYLARTGQKLNP